MNRRRRLISISLILISTMLACNIPVAGLEQLGGTPTANATMTALFDSGFLRTFAAQTLAAMAPAVTVEPTQPPDTATPKVTDTPVPPTVTNTPTDASTSTPPPTLTPEAGRSGPTVQAYHFRTAPTIDGSWDEWPQAELPVAFITYGKANWSGSKDLAASYKVGWDSDYLYVAVKVRDDQYLQNANGPNIYKGDSIEILFDRNLMGDFSSHALSADDYQVGISPGNGAINGSREAYVWFPKSKAGNTFARITAMTDAPGTYRIEIGLPWSTFGITPESGAIYGFGLSVNDNDNISHNEQQTQISNLPNRHLTDPTTWGELILK